MTDLTLGGAEYSGTYGDIDSLLQSARLAAARSINGLMTVTYWDTGRHSVESEQGGEARVGYAQALLKRLAIKYQAVLPSEKLPAEELGRTLRIVLGGGGDNGE